MQKHWILYFILFCSLGFSQKMIQGQVIDFDTTVPIAFAKISYNDTVITSDWEGRFSIELKNDKKPIIFSYKGYYEKKYYQTIGFLFANQPKWSIISVTSLRHSF